MGALAKYVLTCFLFFFTISRLDLRNTYLPAAKISPSEIIEI